MAKGSAGRPRKVLSREQIVMAQRSTLSNRAAARYLHVSLSHYTKYAKLYKDEDGVSLYEKHLNRSGKGIPKFTCVRKTGEKRYVRHIPLMDIIEGRVPAAHFNPQKLKYRLIESGILKPKCARCGFKEKRPLDGKMPLVLNFRDGDKNNWNLDNIEFLCYNCMFLTGPDSVITEEMVEKAEDTVDRVGAKIKDTFEMDPWQEQFLKDLFKEEKAGKPGEEYIAKF